MKIRTCLLVAAIAAMGCGGGSGNVPVPDGATGQQCTPSASCLSCIKLSCDSQARAALGAGYQSGNFSGGACPNFVACTCNTTGKESVCAQADGANCVTTFAALGACLDATACFDSTCKGNSSSGLTVNGNSMDFGPTEVGTAPSRCMLVTGPNASTIFPQVLNDTDCTAGNCAFSAMPLNCITSDSCDACVTFAPKKAGAATATLSIAPGLNVALSGVGTASTLPGTGGTIIVPGTGGNIGIGGAIGTGGKTGAGGATTVSSVGGNTSIDGGGGIGGSVDAGGIDGIIDAPNTGGIIGNGGRIGTGGTPIVSGTGGIVGSGGVTGAGGITTTGGTGGAANSTRFPIATTSGSERSLGAAFDGTNYLVEILGDQNSDSNMTAQLVSASTGSLVGSRILISALSANSLPPFATASAFDGTNYLVILCDPATNNVRGQFISKAGQLVGSSFFIGQSGGNVAALIFDGINYFVVWDTGSGDNTSDDIHAQFVTPSGTLLGSPVTIAAATNNQEQPTVALGGTNILIAWVDGRGNHGVVDECIINNDTDIYGQLVAKSGASAPGTLMGGNFVINEDSYPSDATTLAAASDGTNYMVFWSDRIVPNSCVGGVVVRDGSNAVHGQLVTAAGATLGGVISVGSGTGQSFPAVMFGGTKYLVTWTDTRSDVNKNFVCDSNEGTCMDIYGQYISTSGLVVGGEFAITTDPGNQGGVVAGFNGGKYFILVGDLVVGEAGPAWGDVYGMFMSP